MHATAAEALRSGRRGLDARYFEDDFRMAGARGEELRIDFLV
jgi:hypothetical protein